MTTDDPTDIAQLKVRVSQWGLNDAISRFELCENEDRIKEAATVYAAVLTMENAAFNLYREVMRSTRTKKRKPFWKRK